MAIDFSLANSGSMRCPAPQRFVRQYLQTLRGLAASSDPTRGQLYSDVASSGGTPVYVISDFYYPSRARIAINIMWRGQFYRVLAYMPEAVGRDKAYIVDALGALTPKDAMGRAHKELQAHRQLQSCNSRTASVAQQGAATQNSNSDSSEPYANIPGAGEYANFPGAGEYANFPGAGQYANMPASPYGVVIPAQ